MRGSSFVHRAQEFTGKERDAETGLDYFGARYYSGAQGRFTSPDAPFADQFVEDPQSWNLYSYVGNNPLGFVDSDGRGKMRAAKAVLQRLQVGFEQIMVRHEGKAIRLKEAKDRVMQEGGDAIFDSESAARRAAGGRGAKRHDAHTRTAGEDALPHYHPTDSAGKKLRPHAFIRHPGNIIIPGAAIGVGVLGDNPLGQSIDFLNPLSDVQDSVTLMDKTIIPSLFRLIDKYLMNPPAPKAKMPEAELRPQIEVRICFDPGNCKVQ